MECVSVQSLRSFVVELIKLYACLSAVFTPHQGRQSPLGTLCMPPVADLGCRAGDDGQVPPINGGTLNPAQSEGAKIEGGLSFILAWDTY